MVRKHSKSLCWMIYYWEGALLFAAEFRLAMTRSARDRLATCKSFMHSQWLVTILPASEYSETPETPHNPRIQEWIENATNISKWFRNQLQITVPKSLFLEGSMLCRVEINCSSRPAIRKSFTHSQWLASFVDVDYHQILLIWTIPWMVRKHSKSLCWMIYYWEGALLFAAEFRLAMTRSARDRLATCKSFMHSQWLVTILPASEYSETPETPHNPRIQEWIENATNISKWFRNQLQITVPKSLFLEGSMLCRVEINCSSRPAIRKSFAHSQWLAPIFCRCGLSSNGFHFNNTLNGKKTFQITVLNDLLLGGCTAFCSRIQTHNDAIGTRSAGNLQVFHAFTVTGYNPSCFWIFRNTWNTAQSKNPRMDWKRYKYLQMIPKPTPNHCAKKSIFGGLHALPRGNQLQQLPCNSQVFRAFTVIGSNLLSLLGIITWEIQQYLEW